MDGSQSIIWIKQSGKQSVTYFSNEWPKQMREFANTFDRELKIDERQLEYSKAEPRQGPRERNLGGYSSGLMVDLRGGASQTRVWDFVSNASAEFFGMVSLTIICLLDPPYNLGRFPAVVGWVKFAG